MHQLRLRNESPAHFFRLLVRCCFVVVLTADFFIASHCTDTRLCRIGPSMHSTIKNGKMRIVATFNFETICLRAVSRLHPFAKCTSLSFATGFLLYAHLRFGCCFFFFSFRRRRHSVCHQPFVVVNFRAPTSVRTQN